MTTRPRPRRPSTWHLSLVCSSLFSLIDPELGQLTSERAGGSKVEAKTPDGTRIGTPVQASGSTAPGSSLSASPSRPTSAAGGASTSSAAGSSYASALRSTPSDWHLEFSLNGKPIALDATIYGAIHRSEQGNAVATGLQRGIWSGVYTVTFKKVPGPAPALGTSTASI